jgi:hypothetical protein
MGSVGGEPRDYLAGVDVVTGKPTPLHPVLDGRVQELAAVGDVLYVAGDFSKVDGQVRSRLAAIDLTSGLLASWNPAANSAFIDPFSFSASEAAFYVTGGFEFIGTRDRPRFAVFPLEGSPRITVQPGNQRVEVGETVQFSVEAEGQGPTHYQWRHNGAPLAGATDPILTVGHATPGDAGEYTVEVSNGRGFVSSRPATLVVAEPVRIFLQPISQSLQPGAPLTLTVGVTGGSALQYQWTLNGVNLPGQILPTLTIPSVQPSDGGVYRLSVTELGQSANSVPAEVSVRAPVLPFADNFEDRGKIMDAGSGAGTGNNIKATAESTEPHVAKGGGKSLWLSWQAPSDGIAVFDTRGSAFDTVLAIYTGSSLGTLTELGSDDDGGGFLTSRVTFTAIKGLEYQIAVDGFFGASGNVVLNWRLESVADVLPRILLQPENQAVGLGADATFRVVATALGRLQYQWLFNCAALLDQTNDTLQVRAVGPGQVGLYSVQVSSAERTVESDRVTLQINSTIGGVVKVFARDKLPDVLQTELPRTLRVSGPRVRPQFAAVAQGSTGLQIFNTFGATKAPQEPNHCGVAGGASYWFALRVDSDGLLSVSTEGSDFDTVLAVYTWPGTILDPLVLVACDDNGGRNGQDSFLRFSASHGAIYYIAVDGVNGTVGTVRLSYALDRSDTSLTGRQVGEASGPLSAFQASFDGENGRRYRIQASTDFGRWFTLGTTNLTTSATFQFTDTNWVRFPKRFYRIVPVP